MRGLPVKRILLFCALFFFSFFLIGAGKKDIKASKYNNDSSQRIIRYSFTLQNTTNQPLPEIKFWVYAPVKENSVQTVIGIKASQPYELIADDKGNQVMYFTFTDIPPYANRIAAIEATLLLSKKLHPAKGGIQDFLMKFQWLGKFYTFPYHKKVKNSRLKDSKIYLKPEKYIESDNPEITRVSKILKAAASLKTAKNIFTWITENIKGAGYIEESRGALYALKNKKADCTEYAYLFAALCRANNIPSRVIGGYICADNKAIRPEEYHNWAEFYYKGKWRLVDPQKKVFMDKEPDYIAMEIISESNNNPMNRSYRFRFEGEGVKVRMNG